MAIGWVPLALLTALHGDFIRADREHSFLLDFGIHTRFLVAAPLLILAEAICVPRLAAISREFVNAGLIARADYSRWESAVTSSEDLMDSRVAQMLLIVLAYALAYPMVMAAPPGEIEPWHGGRSLSALYPAGWWALLISLPLLLWLLLGWLWRIFLWTRFLWRMNRLPLQLDPPHPDHAGGLRFVGSSLEAFLPFGLAMGLIAAGPVMKQVVYHHADPLQFRSVAIGAAVTVLVLCGGPLLVFVGRLIELRQSARLQYGALAMRIGARFRLSWLSPEKLAEQTAADMSQLSGTNAMYSIVENAFRLRILPVEFRTAGLLILVTLLPFIPVWLLAVPFREIFRTLGAFLV
jgi:hypothetical protein